MIPHIDQKWVFFDNDRNIDRDIGLMELLDHELILFHYFWAMYYGSGSVSPLTIESIRYTPYIYGYTVCLLWHNALFCFFIWYRAGFLKPWPLIDRENFIVDALSKPSDTHRKSPTNLPENIFPQSMPTYHCHCSVHPIPPLLFVGSSKPRSTTTLADGTLLLDPSMAITPSSIHVIIRWISLITNQHLNIYQNQFDRWPPSHIEG